MNQKDCRGEKADFVRVLAQESTPVAMTAKEVERESENDPELCSVKSECTEKSSKPWPQLKT